MAHKELLTELIKRKEALEAEFKAINTLIRVYADTEDAIQVPNKKDVTIDKEVRNTSGANFPKGKNSWSDYALKLLKEVGHAKASQIAHLAILANPDIPENRIKFAISSKLSKLYKANTIKADVPANKKDGYVYRIKESE